jgi:hypothetical protein
MVAPMFMRPSEDNMKFAATLFALLLVLFLALDGCSNKEEVPPLEEKIKVVRTITKPTPKKEKRAVVFEQAVPEVEASPLEVREEMKAEVKTPGSEADLAPTVAAEDVSGEAERTSLVVVEEGDTLSSIAAREDIYGDPLKWPILYRMNKEILDSAEGGAIHPGKEIAPGTELELIDPQESAKKLSERSDHTWVVNVMSSTLEEEIIPVALSLINKGFPVYITRVTLKNKEWLRLRVGFFRTKTEADVEGKKIMHMLNLVDSWTARIREEELAEYGGF